ncbi:la-related protein 6-like [Varroa jacobsoni]|uniref:la-related protein 6-like n=1 Tax=Varroa jacobsoni TaxID=62625 RepID=UPI000BF450D3|nr:la-related protein 6-like [Varroa jacobsoni]
MVKCEETLLNSSSGKGSVLDSSEDMDVLPRGPEQLLRIRQQIEFYLSDEVVYKDQFLLKHVTKSKEGWLSLKLMSSFRKVKSLCKGYDWRIVAEALRTSELLEVNEDGCKVRPRFAALEEDGTKPARSIIIWAKQQSLQFLEERLLEDIFRSCGPMQNVRIVSPGEPIDDTTRKIFARYPKHRQLSCAVIEFEKSESATEALSVVVPGFQIVLLKDCLKPITKRANEKIVNREKRIFSDSEVSKRFSVRSKEHASTQVNTLLSWRDRSQPVEIKPRVKSFCQSLSYQSKKAEQKEFRIVKSKNEAPCPKNSMQLEVRPRRFTIDEIPNTSYLIRQPRGPDGTRGFH